MIESLLVDINKTALDIIEESPYTFHLGGSRRMNQKYGEGIIPINKDTDWDFYATWTPEIENWLSVKGFLNSTTAGDYFDDECISILKLDNVQVVLRNSAEFYGLVFDSISVDFYIRYLWKSAPWKGGSDEGREMIGPIFNQLFATAHAREKWYE